MSDDDVWVRLQAPATRESAVPPALYAVPATDLPPLEQGTVVTVGEPGEYWLLDELLVGGGPTRGEDGREWYVLWPWTEQGASLPTRGRGNHPSGEPDKVGRDVPADRIWVYRDATQTHVVDELPPPDIYGWVHRVGDARMPPPVLHARPAREATHLVGQRVRVPATVAGQWYWMVAVTEPLETDGDVAVGVVSISDYWSLVYGYTPPDKHVFHPALHTVWIY